MHEIMPDCDSTRPASVRPEITVDGRTTRVIAEQTSVADPQRLGPSVGRLPVSQLRAVDDALALVLGLW